MPWDIPGLDLGPETILNEIAHGFLNLFIYQKTSSTSSWIHLIIVPFKPILPEPVTVLLNKLYICKGKGKAVLLQAWNSPEGSR